MWRSRFEIGRAVVCIIVVALYIDVVTKWWISPGRIIQQHVWRSDRGINAAMTIVNFIDKLFDVYEVNREPGGGPCKGLLIGSYAGNGCHILPC